jgi:ABC-2 type transport system ATP-binding protein
VVRGPQAGKLIPELRRLPGVEQAAPFGTNIHVVGRDGGLIEREVRQFAAAHHLQAEPGETSLEDVFIRHMTAAQEARP